MFVDPDPDSESGSTDLIKSVSDPNPQHGSQCRILSFSKERIHSFALGDFFVNILPDFS
jgi:hypothetical protein